VDRRRVAEAHRLSSYIPSLPTQLKMRPVDPDAGQSLGGKWPPAIEKSQ
jgi:hypothetical protein